MLGAEDRVELRQRQMVERVVLVDEDHVRIVEEVGLEASRGDVDAGRRIAPGALEGPFRAGADLLSEDGEVPRAGEEGADRRGGPVHPKVERNAGLTLVQACHPALHQGSHEVVLEAAVAPQDYGAGDTLGRLVDRQLVHEGDRWVARGRIRRALPTRGCDSSQRGQWREHSEAESSLSPGDHFSTRTSR